MSEYVLIVWLLIAGQAISEPTEAGTYRSLSDCEAEATRQADNEAELPKDPRYASVWKCIKRDK